MQIAVEAAVFVIRIAPLAAKQGIRIFFGVAAALLAVDAGANALRFIDLKAEFSQIAVIPFKINNL